MGRGLILERIAPFLSVSEETVSSCGISSPFGELSPTPGQITHVLRTRSPLTLAGPLDLHVLSAPPAFVLSQDQTLQDILESIPACPAKEQAIWIDIWFFANRASFWLRL